MKTFGEYLFDFVKGALDKYSGYSLHQLNVSALESGFDYALALNEDMTLGFLKQSLTDDLAEINLPPADVPITISLVLHSKKSGAFLNRRFLETLVVDEEEEEEPKQKCCNKSRCCCKNNKEAADELTAEDRKELCKAFRDFFKFFHDNAEKNGFRAHCFGAVFPEEDGFPFF